MLKRLAIQNLAILENVEIAFDDGFTVLTGESGAGKSLVIDSLTLLLGGRASSELIRQGQDKATIKGEFISSSPRLSGLLSSLDIPFSNGELTIERTIGKSKSTIKANGITLTLSELSKIARLLSDIHSQYDVMKILNPENYLSIIDSYRLDLINPLKESYLEAYRQYLEKSDEVAKLEKDKADLDSKRDFYEFQYKELKDAGLEEKEKEALEAELATLQNYDKVYAIAMEAKSIIDEGPIDKLYDLSRIIKKLEDYLSELKGISDNMDETYFTMVDTLSAVSKKIGRLDYDPARLDEIQQRLFDIANLERKYKKDVKGLLDYFHRLSSMLDQDNGVEERLNRAKEEKAKAYASALSKGNDLSKVRQTIAKGIEKEVKTNLEDLLLESRFEIAFVRENEPTLTENGLDSVDFLIETNIGEGLKPLSKVISGGEASRIMLAFKAIFIKANRIETVIFDEIDTGISGTAAMAVANKIKEISYSRQVISITHLPQVAASASHHILIEKKVKDGRTYTSIKSLGLEEKIEEIAHLISGGKVSDSQRQYAREMVLGKNE
ncbi:MAG: DNA repair protein RecN [Bacilli bacterium]|nr:DNA repair protein RecN [Bacilli bacterium]